MIVCDIENKHIRHLQNKGFSDKSDSFSLACHERLLLLFPQIPSTIIYTRHSPIQIFKSVSCRCPPCCIDYATAKKVRREVTPEVGWVNQDSGPFQFTTEYTIFSSCLEYRVLSQQAIATDRSTNVNVWLSIETAGAGYTMSQQIFHDRRVYGS